MKINFTQEHQQRLNELLLKFLLLGTIFEGIIGTTMNVFQLLHEVSVSTLQNMYANIKRQIEKINSLDTWSLTRHQENKLKNLEEMAELVNLLIGYKRYKDQLLQEENKIKELKKQYKQLKQSSLTPEEQMNSLEKTIKELGGNIEEDEESNT